MPSSQVQGSFCHMTGRPPLQLLDLPTEILTAIYELCASSVVAEADVPARKYISPHGKPTDTWLLKPHRSPPHRHRFHLKDEDGSEVTIGLLSVNNEIRQNALQFFAARNPLKLKINSYAPSVFTRPDAICPKGWAEHVKELTLPRYVGFTASLSDLVSRFPNLKTVTVICWPTRFYQPRYPPMFQENLQTFREWVQSGVFARGRANDLKICLDEARKSFCAKDDRLVRVRAKVGYCWFATERYNHVDHVSRHNAMVS